MMRILANENLSATVIQTLRAHGHDVLSVNESLRGETDSANLARASRTATGRDARQGLRRPGYSHWRTC